MALWSTPEFIGQELDATVDVGTMSSIGKEVLCQRVINISV